MGLLDKFKLGCYGNFLRFSKGTNDLKTLVALVTHVVLVPTASEHEIWLRVGLENIHLSAKALITWLCFGISNFDPDDPNHQISNGGFVDRRYGNSCPMVKAVYDDFKGFKLQRENHYLKSAYILMFYFMLICFDKRRTIDVWLCVLI